MICNIGINDMPRGWMYQSELNKKIYFTWKDMITRCYSENFHKKIQHIKIVRYAISGLN